jgi:hypothetical protein
MDTPELKKVSAKIASEIYAHYDLEEEIASGIPGDLSPARFLSVLIEAERFAEAAKFMAYALPKREAAWLACLAAKTTLDEDSPKAFLDAIEKSEKWVYQSNEQNRRMAMQAAETAGFDNPAGLAAAASAWSGGSLAPEGSPDVPPPGDLTAKADWGCLALSAYHGDPVKAPHRYHTFLNQALDIANGGSGKIE